MFLLRGIYFDDVNFVRKAERFTNGKEMLDWAISA